MNEQGWIDRLASFSDFAEIPEEVRLALVESGMVMPLAAGQVLASQGDSCEFFPLPLSGRARIYTMDDDGREITLYRIGPGEGCVLAAACSLSGEPLPGFAVIERGGDALLIPAGTLRGWVARHGFWRDYVFSLVARQLGKVVAITNGLAFQHLDARIAGFLLDGAREPGDTVRATHHAVAMEVGTRREVASRILKGFEHDGLVTLERGKIRVRDPRALAERAGRAASLSPVSVT